MKLHSISNKSARTRGAIQFLGFSYKTTGLPKKGVRNFHEVTWPWSESMSENVQGRQKLLCSRRGGALRSHLPTELMNHPLHAEKAANLPTNHP